MREVILYGPMRAKFGRSFRFDVKSVGEAFKALNATVPGFKSWFAERARAGASYKVLIGKRAVATGEIPIESISDQPIRIVPIVQGSKSNKILGGLLAITGIAIMLFVGSMTGTIGIIGLAMTIGGVAMMMVPTPKMPTSSESNKSPGSQSFDGPVNSTNPGNAVPLLYGVMEVGSVVVSASISATDYLPVYYNGGGGSEGHTEMGGGGPGWDLYPVQDGASVRPDNDFTQWNP